MRRRPRRFSPGRQQPDISLNSFLDLVLNILLFFVFATELAILNSLNVSVPRTEYGESTPKDRDALVVVITKENRYYIDAEEIAVEDLPEQLRRRKQAGHGFDSLVLRGDLESRLQATVDVLGACNQAGITKVRIETEKPRAERKP